MRETGAFWAATRLVEFANLPVSRMNWRSLWLQRAPSGELRETFENEMCRRHEAPTPDEFRERFRRAEIAFSYGTALLSDSPLAPWPRVGRYGSLQRLHRLARTWLRTICADRADLRPIIRGLGGFGTATTERLYALPTDLDAPGTVDFTRCPMPAPHLPHFKDSTAFSFHVKGRRDTLRRHLEWLFVRTATAGLWRRFYRCATCGRFAVSRLRRDALRREASKFCSTPCRAAHHRREGREHGGRSTTRATREMVGRAPHTGK
jgi:hypothetical protein